MRDKINHLAKGETKGISPQIELDTEEIHAELNPGETPEIELHLNTESEVPIKGLAYSSFHDISICPSVFSGYQTRVTIMTDKKLGDKTGMHLGEFTLVTNGGEFHIPASFTVHEKEVSSALKKISDISDFEKIAREDPDSAIRIFESKAFYYAPCLDDIKTRALYGAFVKRPDKKLALEQFLLACGVPSPVFPKEMDLEEVSLDDASEENLEEGLDRSRRHYYKKYLHRFLRARLAYEVGPQDPRSMVAEMEDDLHKMASAGCHPELVTLLLAENAYLRHDIVDASGYLEKVSEFIRNNRQEFLFEYFLLEYLDVTIYNKRERSLSLVRLAKKYIEDNGMTQLFYIPYKLDDDLKSDPIGYRNYMNTLFDAGSRSPLLYLEYCRLLNEHPDLVMNATKLDILAIRFGTRYDLLTDEVIQNSLNGTLRANIKNDNRSTFYHPQYAAGVSANLKITGLNEYFLYSLPDDHYEIPDKVLEYFAMSDALDIHTRCKLYDYVITNKHPNSNIYKAYENRIVDFALNQLKERRINLHLAHIYEKMLKPEMVDTGYSDSLPYILASYRIEVKSPAIRSVVVLYPQIKKEYFYQLKNGVAFIPIYNEHAILLFQDVYGNRYYEQEYSMTKLISNSALDSVVDKLFSDTVARKLDFTLQLLQKKTVNADDIENLEKAEETLEFTDTYKKLINAKLIDYYAQHSASGYHPDFLDRIDTDLLSEEERNQLIKAYISSGCTNDAFQLVNQYGYDDIPVKSLRTMAVKLLQEDPENSDPVFLSLCYYCLKNSTGDTVIAEHLCHYYNGPTDNMYFVLKKAIELHAETYDMEERLLAQIIFVNDYQHIDEVFHWYASRKKASETVVKAYFTIKAHDYFVNNAETPEQTFGYLENVLTQTDDSSKFPVLYELSLLKHYSESPTALTEVQKILAERFAKELTEEGYYFPFMKNLPEGINLPAEIQNYEIIACRHDPGQNVQIRSRVLPQESNYLNEVPDCSYENILCKKKLLFGGETWEYEFYIQKDDGSEEILQHDRIRKNAASSNDGSRDSYLNEIGSFILEKDEEKTRRAMEQYLSAEETAVQLFTIA